MARSDLPARDHANLPDILPEPGHIALSDLSDALTLGWRDFRRAPAFGLIFSAFYVLGGWALASNMPSAMRWTSPPSASRRASRWKPPASCVSSLNSGSGRSRPWRW